jgi:hypothetical protein
VHELHAGEGTLGSFERFESEHGTRDPFDGSMVLFHDIIETVAALPGLSSSCTVK